MRALGVRPQGAGLIETVGPALPCANEAAFKAWFPLTRRSVELTDVSTVVSVASTPALGRVRVTGSRR